MIDAGSVIKKRQLQKHLAEDLPVEDIEMIIRNVVEKTWICTTAIAKALETNTTLSLES